MTRQFSSPVVLFKEALLFYRRHFPIIVYLLALPVLLRAVIRALDFEGFNVSVTVAIIASVLVNLLAQIILIHIVADGGALTIRNYFKQSWPIFWPFVWVTILAGLVSFAAAVLLIVPGVIVGVFLLFSSFIVVTEDKRGVEALRSSWRYVRGNWWAVFGRLLFLILVLGLALAAVYLVSLIFAGFPIGQEVVSAVISGLILSPVGTIYLFFLYRELKNEL